MKSDYKDHSVDQLARCQYVSIACRFHRVVDDSPESVAVLYSDTEYKTYSDLDKLSNQAANFLLNLDLKRRARACIISDKCIESYAVILGCIKVGIGYFVIDPQTPIERIRSIFEVCTPNVIFLEDADSINDLRGDSLPQLIEYRELEGQSDERVSTDLARPTDPAYIMFTSGSTGEPKGVVISHDNLSSFIDWAANEYDFQRDDIHTHINPLYFDNSIFDIYSTFFSGGALVPIKSEELRDPYTLTEKIRELKCTTIFGVPSMYMFLQTTRSIEDGQLMSLKRVIFGGEGYPLSRLRELRKYIRKDAKLINVYGPTECTCICSSHIVTEDDLCEDKGFPPIGKILDHFSFVLVDDGKEAEIGDVGELCLSGPCVGQGYIGRAEQTKTAFRNNPVNNEFLEASYMTGDLMVINKKDGLLRFVGRKDCQIKHQGYRIELEEIQHGLNKVIGVEESAAIHIQQEGSSSIVGFVASQESLIAADIKKAVADYLPRYMIPSRIVVLTHLPKNANGKTDRAKLRSLLR